MLWFINSNINVLHSKNAEMYIQILWLAYRLEPCVLASTLRSIVKTYNHSQCKEIQFRYYLALQTRTWNTGLAILSEILYPLLAKWDFHDYNATVPSVYFLCLQARSMFMCFVSHFLFACFNHQLKVIPKFPFMFSDLGSRSFSVCKWQLS